VHATSKCMLAECQWYAELLVLLEGFAVSGDADNALDLGQTHDVDALTEV